jgi:hypothetical protein
LVKVTRECFCGVDLAWAINQLRLLWINFEFLISLACNIFFDIHLRRLYVVAVMILLSEIYEAILARARAFPIFFQRRLSTEVRLPRKRASVIILFETGHCFEIQTVRFGALENRGSVGRL